LCLDYINWQLAPILSSLCRPHGVFFYQLEYVGLQQCLWDAHSCCNFWQRMLCPPHGTYSPLLGAIQGAVTSASRPTIDSRIRNGRSFIYFRSGVSSKWPEVGSCLRWLLPQGIHNTTILTLIFFLAIVYQDYFMILWAGQFKDPSIRKLRACPPLSPFPMMPFRLYDPELCSLIGRMRLWLRGGFLHFAIPGGIQGSFAMSACSKFVHTSEDLWNTDTVGEISSSPKVGMSTGKAIYNTEGC
jgi:hypothetical protein